LGGAVVPVVLVATVVAVVAGGAVVDVVVGGAVVDVVVGGAVVDVVVPDERRMAARVAGSVTDETGLPLTSR